MLSRLHFAFVIFFPVVVFPQSVDAQSQWQRDNRRYYMDEFILQLESMAPLADCADSGMAETVRLAAETVLRQYASQHCDAPARVFLGNAVCVGQIPGMVQIQAGAMDYPRGQAKSSWYVNQCVQHALASSQELVDQLKQTYASLDYVHYYLMTETPTSSPTHSPTRMPTTKRPSRSPTNRPTTQRPAAIHAPTKAPVPKTPSQLTAPPSSQPSSGPTTSPAAAPVGKATGSPGNSPAFQEFSTTTNQPKNEQKNTVASATAEQPPSSSSSGSGNSFILIVILAAILAILVVILCVVVFVGRGRRRRHWKTQLALQAVHKDHGMTGDAACVGDCDSGFDVQDQLSTASSRIVPIQPSGSATAAATKKQPQPPIKDTANGGMEVDLKKAGPPSTRSETAASQRTSSSRLERMLAASARVVRNLRGGDDLASASRTADGDASYETTSMGVDEKDDAASEGDVAEEPQVPAAPSTMTSLGQAMVPPFTATSILARAGTEAPALVEARSNRNEAVNSPSSTIMDQPSPTSLKPCVAGIHVNARSRGHKRILSPSMAIPVLTQRQQPSPENVSITADSTCSGVEGEKFEDFAPDKTWDPDDASMGSASLSALMTIQRCQSSSFAGGSSSSSGGGAAGGNGGSGSSGNYQMSPLFQNRAPRALMPPDITVGASRSKRMQRSTTAASAQLPCSGLGGFGGHAPASLDIV